MVDFVPDLIQVPEIWGLAVDLGSDESGRLRGRFRVAAVQDLWLTRSSDGLADARNSASLGGLDDSKMGGMYQSVLTDVQWTKSDLSPLLGELRRASLDRYLSIKFVLDRYRQDPADPKFTYGRIVGTIGPAIAEPAGAPDQYAGQVLCRELRSTDRGRRATAYAKIHRTGPPRITLDLGNSVPMDKDGNPASDLGWPLSVVATKGIGPTKEDLFCKQVFENPSMFVYRQTAGITDVGINADESDALWREGDNIPSPSPLEIRDQQGNVLWSEDPTGTFIRTERSLFRLNPEPDDPARPGDVPLPDDLPGDVTLVATVFGQPAAGAKVSLEFRTDANELLRKGDESLNLNMTPDDNPVSTDEWGRAKFSLRATPLPKDNLLLIRFSSALATQVNGSTTGEDLIWVVIFAKRKIPDEPQWDPDVKPILQQYAYMYPSMRRALDLADQNTMEEHRDLLRLALTRPLTDPDHMPVSRDLSRSERRVLLRWLRQHGNRTDGGADGSGS
jgi:hypothetical protein